MADQRDFEAFVVARSAALLRTAYLLTGDAHDAEDLLQRALIRTVPVWHRLEGHPEAYVRRILVRENISRWRSRRWREVSVEQVPEVAASSGSPEDRALLLSALSHLAPKQRAVVVLRYFEDLTEAETAKTLGVSIGTVKSQHSDALRKLRQLLPDLDAERVDTPGETTAAPEGAVRW